MKKINNGKDDLIPKDKWVDASDLHGDDELILNHPIMIEAQEKIIQKYNPKSKIALVSLCSATRPYSKSRKWKVFIEKFKNTELIICSNGGVIPIEYENQYPYLTYDAHGDKKFDDLYTIYTVRNIIRFFVLVKFDYIIFNFRPTLRNKKAGVLAGRYLKSKGHIKDFVICPNDYEYKQAQKDGFAAKGLSMYPDIHPFIIKALENNVKRFTKKK